MIRISKLADYSVVVLAALASYSGDMMSVSALSGETKLPEPTISKVLKLLSKNGIVASTRGINGGYTLSYKPEDITVERIVTAVDGPIAVTACADGSMPDCHVGDSCPVRGRWDDVNMALRNALSSVTLADMIKTQDHAAPVMAHSEEKENHYGSH